MDLVRDHRYGRTMDVEDLFWESWVSRIHLNKQRYNRTAFSIAGIEYHFGTQGYRGSLEKVMEVQMWESCLERIYFRITGYGGSTTITICIQDLLGEQGVLSILYTLFLKVDPLHIQSYTCSSLRTIGMEDPLWEPGVERISFEKHGYKGQNVQSTCSEDLVWKQ